MGALMVADLQPTARYQPAEPYINRATPKSRGGLEGERGTNETKREKHKDTSRIFKCFFKTPYHK